MGTEDRVEDGKDCVIQITGMFLGTCDVILLEMKTCWQVKDLVAVQAEVPGDRLVGAQGWRSKGQGWAPYEDGSEVWVVTVGSGE